jgi:excisionase family DNA binding protein
MFRVTCGSMWTMRANTNNRTLLTVPQAAERLGISPKTAWAWVYDRRLPVARFGNRCVRVPSDALDKLIGDAIVPARPESQ